MAGRNDASNSLPCTVGHNDSGLRSRRPVRSGNEINGVYQETVDGRVKLYTYVVKE